MPLTDLGIGTYKGFDGGLYPGGSGTMPEGHAREGLIRASMIRPLALDGNPDPGGKIVLLTVGMSNTHLESCGKSQVRSQCNPWTFIGRAESDPEVNHESLVIVNGARGAQVAVRWDSVDDENYSRVNQSILPGLGLSEKQVQIAWVKVANFGARIALPDSRADAYLMLRTLGDIVRALTETYPNLQQVFVSSRIYAGFATHMLNPEPFAYEYGFSVKWLIESQMRQDERQRDDFSELAGDLDYDSTTWLAWGPYLWARADVHRSDGLIWEQDDFDPKDGTHPSETGQAKVGDLLLEFFKTSPFTQCWFLAGRNCQVPS